MRSSGLESRSLQTRVAEPAGWWERMRRRRRLARQDRLGGHLAELARIRELIGAARDVVAAGWIQDAWFVCPDERGRGRRVDLVQARRRSDLPVAGACLVGAIMHAHGEVAAAGDQVVQRTFDLTWHALHRDEREPVRWCPAPAVRAQQLLDLVRWNDRLGRTRADVDALLAAAERTAGAEIARHRLELTS